jgi:heterodisulfide reductase subunit B
MKVGYFPGCSLDGTSKEYNDSLIAVSEKCGIELTEIKDWNCCGATAAHSLNHDLAIALPARSLALAAEQGFKDIIVPCASCYSRLSTSLFEINKSADSKHKIEKIIELKIEGNLKVLNVFDFLEKYILPVIDNQIVSKFNHKAACYYGCLLVRPKEIANIERYEDPLIMENILSKTGATFIDWAFKTECCGAGFSISKTDVVANLSAKIVEDAFDRGAESIVVACPMCHSNLDMRRPLINKYLKKDIQIPVMFITQALGLSMGISPEKLGMDKHFISTKKITSSLVNKEL